MKTCCHDRLALEIGETCPTCGKTVTAEAANFTPKIVVVSPPPPIGFVVPVGFRFQPEGAGTADSARFAERRAKGWNHRRPARKRQATANQGPKGRQRRRHLIATE